MNTTKGQDQTKYKADRRAWEKAQRPDAVNIRSSILNEFEVHTRKETAKMLGVTVACVALAENRALAKLCAKWKELKAELLTA